MEWHKRSFVQANVELFELLLNSSALATGGLSPEAARNQTATAATVRPLGAIYPNDGPPKPWFGQSMRWVFPLLFVHDPTPYKVKPSPLSPTRFPTSGTFFLLIAGDLRFQHHVAI